MKKSFVVSIALILIVTTTSIGTDIDEYTNITGGTSTIKTLSEGGDTDPFLGENTIKQLYQELNIDQYFV